MQTGENMMMYTQKYGYPILFILSCIIDMKILK